MTEQDRCIGALIGLAVGDALGTTLEFKAPGTFEPITDMVGGGPFRLRAGQWTDDTSMALCLAESLIERGGHDPEDQMRRYLRWMKEGHLSSTGECFDVGITTRDALLAFAKHGNPYAGPTDPYTAGNGSLMRLAPVPIRFRKDPDTAIDHAGDSSRTTHGAPSAIDACRYFAGLIVGAIQGRSKQELLSPAFHPTKGTWDTSDLHNEIAEVAYGSFIAREPPAIVGSGFVVRSLEAALWAFSRTDDFRSGALLAVNLGNDADTTGAIYGQIAGAHYGLSGIPVTWVEKLAMREAVEALARGLLSGRSGS